jgi:aminoglycoside phosphotransferase (APT) family kinase protein
MPFAVDRQIEFLKRAARAAEVEREPLLNAVFDWLDTNKCAAKQICLCWGDARLGNMLYADGKIAAVLDWDLVHLGDPEGDVGCWSA